MPFIQLAISDVVVVSLVTGVLSFLGTSFIALIGFLQWRKSHTVEIAKTSNDGQDKFRDDILNELNTVRQRMDSLTTVNAALMSKEMTAQILSAQQQSQIMELTRRSERADRFEQQVSELKQVNHEQGEQIKAQSEQLKTQGEEILRLRKRILELEKGTH